MGNIGFLSFGHWSGAPGSHVRTAGEMLADTVNLAVAAEEAGLDGAWVRVHHFEQNTSSPFPILTAMGMKTSRIELGTGVIDMRYENPLYMAEAASTADLLVGGRLQLGVSRGSPGAALDGPADFGHHQPEGLSAAEWAAERIDLFRRAIAGEGIAEPGPNAQGIRKPLPVQPQAPGLKDRIWYGAGNIESARRVGELGMHLMSSTLVLEATGEPLGTLQARQIEAYHEAWQQAGHPGRGRVSISRSIMPIFDQATSTFFGGLLARDQMGVNQDQIGIIDDTKSTFGKTYVGAPDKIVADLADDEAIPHADTLLITVPNQLGADFNFRTFEVIAKEIKPRLALV